MTKRKINKMIIVIVLMISLLSFLGWRTKSFGNFFSYFISPVGGFFSTISTWGKDKFIFLKSIGELKNINQRLFEENLSLRVQNTQLSAAEKENEILRKEMDLAPREKYDLTAALIIGRKTMDQSSGVYINKGSNQGIQAGMAVVVGRGVLVGEVVKSWAQMAKIRLITNKKFKTNAKLLQSGGKGVVSGQYGTAIKMKMIAQSVKVNKNDMVVTSELSDIFPPELLIGYVQNVYNTPDGLFQEATILSPVNLDNLHLVWVVTEF